MTDLMKEENELTNVDDGGLHDLLMVASYLDIPELTQIACEKINEKTSSEQKDETQAVSPAESEHLPHSYVTWRRTWNRIADENLIQISNVQVPKLNVQPQRQVSEQKADFMLTEKVLTEEDMVRMLKQSKDTDPTPAKLLTVKWNVVSQEIKTRAVNHKPPTLVASPIERSCMPMNTGKIYRPNATRERFALPPRAIFDSPENVMHAPPQLPPHGHWLAESTVHATVQAEDVMHGPQDRQLAAVTVQAVAQAEVQHAPQNGPVAVAAQQSGQPAAAQREQEAALRSLLHNTNQTLEKARHHLLLCLEDKAATPAPHTGNRLVVAQHEEKPSIQSQDLMVQVSQSDAQVAVHQPHLAGDSIQGLRNTADDKAFLPPKQLASYPTAAHVQGAAPIALTSHRENKSDPKTPIIKKGTPEEEVVLLRSIGIFPAENGGWRGNVEESEFAIKTIFDEDGGRYVGTCTGTVKHGRGVCWYSNGDKYCGDWKNGMRHGKGRMDWTDGSTFEGRTRESLQMHRCMFELASRTLILMVSLKEFGGKT